MADGLWSMTDDGEFVLQEPYKTMLAEARQAATQGWYRSLIEYLEPRCPYIEEQLRAELLRRNERPERKVNVFEEFVLEALSGDL